MKKLPKVTNIEECAGYKSLLSAVEQSEKDWPNTHDYRGKFAWAIQRANHYAEKTGLDASEILNMWEKNRDYWFMNYYQESNQPEIKGDKVRVFDTSEDFKEAIGKEGFRCPMCDGKSSSPYVCDSGLDMSPGKKCDWKSYGLFGTLGKGVFIFIKAGVKSGHIFKPIAWES